MQLDQTHNCTYVSMFAGSMEEKESDNSQRKKKRSREQEKSDMDSSDEEDIGDDERIHIQCLDRLHTYQYREQQVMGYDKEVVEDARRRINEFYSKYQGVGAENLIQKRLRDYFLDDSVEDKHEEHSSYSDYNLHLLHDTADSVRIVFDSSEMFNQCMRGFYMRECFHFFDIDVDMSFKDLSVQVSNLFDNLPDLANDKDVYIKWQQQQIKEALALRLDSAVSEALCKSLLLLQKICYKTKTNEEAKAEQILSDQQLADPRNSRHEVFGTLLEVINIRRLDMIRVLPTWVVTYVTGEGLMQRGLFEMAVYERPFLMYTGFDKTLLKSDQRAKVDQLRLSKRAFEDLPDFTPPSQWMTTEASRSVPSMVGLVACGENQMPRFCNPPFVLWIDGVNPFRNQIVLFHTALRKCIDTYILCIEKSMAKQHFLPMSLWRKIGEMLTGAKPKADLNATANAQSMLQSFISKDLLV
jgi:hypothetical protein